MERFFLYIKHHLDFIWNIIDRINGLVFLLIHGKRLKSVLPVVFSDAEQGGLVYRRLGSEDIQPLQYLISAQPQEDFAYFNPHGFTIDALKQQIGKPAFLMMGTFDGEKMAGYFFLRFFANKKCFVGRLIDREYRGRGIGTVMNFIMYETAWRMGFRCLSTISRNNTAVMKAHARNPNMIIVKELSNDYMLVEFVRENKEDKR